MYRCLGDGFFVIVWKDCFWVECFGYGFCSVVGVDCCGFGLCWCFFEESVYCILGCFECFYLFGFICLCMCSSLFGKNFEGCCVVGNNSDIGCL